MSVSYDTHDRSGSRPAMAREERFPRHWFGAFPLFAPAAVIGISFARHVNIFKAHTTSYKKFAKRLRANAHANGPCIASCFQRVFRKSYDRREEYV